jgi:hypothetical protein
MRALVLLNAFAGTVARMGAPGDVALHVREALERVGIKADFDVTRIPSIPATPATPPRASSPRRDVATQAR